MYVVVMMAKLFIAYAVKPTTITWFVRAVAIPLKSKVAPLKNGH
jgi:hypothetical protein